MPGIIWLIHGLMPRRVDRSEEGGSRNEPGRRETDRLIQGRSLILSGQGGGNRGRHRRRSALSHRLVQGVARAKKPVVVCSKRRGNRRRLAGTQRGSVGPIGQIGGHRGGDDG